MLATFVYSSKIQIIYHDRWSWEGVEITFRRVDEEALLKHNASFDGIDEIVLHPDGLITGCWDRNQKVLEFVE